MNTAVLGAQRLDGQAPKVVRIVRDGCRHGVRVRGAQRDGAVSTRAARLLD